MRLLVTGASGFLGWHLLRYLRDNLPGPDAKVTGTYYRVKPERTGFPCVQIDLRGAGEVRALLADLSPTHILHTAAMSLTGDCERNPEAANASNVIATRNLVEAATSLARKPHLLYVSTDLVFDGTQGDYREDDEPNPLQVYGRTKLDGEAELKRYNGDWCIVRSALIYGSATPHKGCFLQWMLEEIRNGKGALFADEYRNPIWVDDLCRALVALLSKRMLGLYHCAGGERHSRWEFGQEVADAYSLDLLDDLRSTRVEHGFGDSRPADVTLNTGKLRAAIAFSPTPLQASLELILDQPTPQ